jgi:D-sedoheptulose 7-phosphate isomerase
VSRLDDIHQISGGHADFARGYFDYVGEILRRIDVGAASEMLKAFEDARIAGKSIYFCGNGGKAALATEWANDLTIALEIAPAFRAFSLTDNAPIITAIGNDHGYEEVFSRQVRALAQPGDVVVGLSGSGRSSNVLAAMRAAKEIAALTIGITGSDGGDLKHGVDISVHIPTEPDDGPIEDAFMALLHMTVMRFKRLY